MTAKLVKRRDKIATALKTVCLEKGCGVSFYSIDTSTMLNADFKWESKEIAQRVLRDLSNADVLIDLTLFGLDEIPAPGMSRLHTFTSLRQELLQGGKLRGADMHIVSDKSFAGGAMCADYQTLAKEVATLEGIVKMSRTLDIVTNKGTDLRIAIDPKQVFKGTGQICAAGEYHFLPSGIVSICLKKGAVSGKLVLDGPCYAVGTFSQFPLTLEIGSNGRIADVDLSEQAPYYDLVMNMFKMEEAHYPGELVFGLNPKGDPHSIQPMEFYVARGTVSIALGRNDHIGGDIEPTSAGSVHVHASITDATVENDHKQIIVEKGQLKEVDK
jgi:leucyl aminopeptidase (aminopeptidase T)